MKSLSLIFFGSSPYSIPVLEALLGAGHKPIVVTTPDKKTGRKQLLSPNPLAAFAKRKRLTVLKPNKLDQKTLKQIKGKPALGICAVYGKIIPKIWLNYFSKGIINLHPSLLPQYRGSSPGVFTILSGKKETGVSFIKMDEKCDHGPIILQIKANLIPEETGGAFYRRLFSLAGRKTVELMGDYLEKRLSLTPQKHSQASFTPTLKRDDGYIKEKAIVDALERKKINHADLPPLVRKANPKKDTFAPEIINRARRAFSPWPGIYTKIEITIKGKKQEMRLKILETEMKEKRLVIKRVQLEGKAPVTFSQFSSAYSWPA